MSGYKSSSDDALILGLLNEFLVEEHAEAARKAVHSDWYLDRMYALGNVLARFSGLSDGRFGVKADQLKQVRADARGGAE